MRGTRVLAAGLLWLASSIAPAWAQTNPKAGPDDRCVRADVAPDAPAEARPATDRLRPLQACGPIRSPFVPREDRTELFDYARVGYSGLLAGSSYGGPAMGVGLRLERESAALDISFLNIQGFIAPSTYVIGPDAPTRTLSGSLVKIEALKFLAAESASSPYVGGGLSAGITEIAGPGRSEHGGGSQAELTAGIEFLRDSPTRAFIQADVILPFYRVVGAPTSGTRGTASSHYAPSVAISVGFGMHHPRRRYAQPPRLPPPPPRFPLPPRFPWRQPPV